MHLSPRTTILAVLTAVGAVACSSSTTTGPSAGAGITIRLVHAAPYAGTADVYDSTGPNARKMVASALAYLGVDSVLTQSGAHWYDFTKSDQTATLAVAGAAAYTFTGSYDAIFLDSLAGGLTPSYAAQLLPTVLPDTVTTNTKLRMVHAAPKLGAVDLYLTPPGLPLSSAGPSASGIPFGVTTQVSTQTYLSVESEATEVRVTPSGDTTAADVAVDTTVTLVAGQALTALVVQRGSDSTRVQLLMVRDH
jgi:hypothetical protein